MASLQDLETLLAQLKSERREAALQLRPDQNPSMLLPPAQRRALAASAASWLDAAPRGDTRRRWSSLASAAAAPTQELGLIRVPAGGLRSLATRLFPDAKDPTRALSRNLQVWEPEGLVKVFSGVRVKRYAPVVAVQVPHLTDCLVWLMHARALALGPAPGPNIIDVEKTAVAFCAARLLPPPAVGSGWGAEYRRELSEDGYSEWTQIPMLGEPLDPSQEKRIRASTKDGTAPSVRSFAERKAAREALGAGDEGS